ncbi:hypothetical protein BV394_06995 [Brevirhabdus pacifica]|uniref:Uncharacterized protein n=1 Tax=Brevirhabdus pacifica TaxID=1267768 RepID=A0A1U7DHL9_9RHOB|nr:hypothetical protein [Brevirhabdus pacifica]APX89494.1 hypothetical protein BV394_06995 [Brevirhabdus pacifica]OWU76498.1 hypothetical protein ATO5_09305 [Loktanella sp. 22II-4b]PJJ85856.1 hypothetical protein CLV77_0387 [Brevirhabdus pacifica]
MTQTDPSLQPTSIPEAVPEAVPASVRSVWPALLLLLLAIAVLVVAQGYSEISARFPTMVAATLAVLASIDLYSRTGLPGGAALDAFWGSGFTRREMTHAPTIRQEAALFAWIATAFGAMTLLGILVGAPLFTTAYVWLQSRRALRTAVGAGGIVFLFEYGVFEQALNYELYRGIIFSADGLAGW